MVQAVAGRAKDGTPLIVDCERGVSCCKLVCIFFFHADLMGRLGLFRCQGRQVWTSLGHFYYLVKEYATEVQLVASDS